MPATPSGAAVRSAAFISTLLLSTAFTAPAFAQIETVVVTAERKAEDIQTVPVAVTALTSADLKAKQVNSFRDLQFHVPSVTYTKSNFGGAQFQIRGITTQFGLGAAIAQNENDVYVEAPALVTGSYFDVDRVEVSRGPQSTSYGRAATGGAVNVITTKPDLDQFSANASVDLGTYGTEKPQAMINIPIIDGELGVRFAAIGVWHDGYEKNLYFGQASVYPGPFDGSKNANINNQGTWSGRASIRWQPSSDTTIDVMAELGGENDRRVRGDQQYCHRDPSGVIGCLPDRLGLDPINTLSTLGDTLGSKQGLTALFNAFGVPFGSAQVLGNTLGLYNLAGNNGVGDPNAGPLAQAILGYSAIPGPFTTTVAPGVYALNPAAVNGPGSSAGGTTGKNLLTVDTAFSPKYLTGGGTYTMNWAQTITSWLKSTLDMGYIDGFQRTFQNYNDASPENISSLISSAVTGFGVVFGSGSGPGLLGASNATGAYNTYFSVPGALPITNTYYNGKFGSYAGIIDPAHGILTKNSINAAYDEDDFSQHELTGELRFQTAFEGPLNVSAGAFYMEYQGRNQYWVAANGLDWESMTFGALAGSLIYGGAPTLMSTTSYDGEYIRDDIQSRSAFIEGTYDIIPDELKAIVGVRYNDDRSSYLTTPVAVGGSLLANGLAVIGTPSCPSPGFIANQPSPYVILPCVGVQMGNRSPTFLNGKNVDSTDKWTGRATVNWTPKLSWTDQTLVYFTASRGELAGGLNKAQGTATLVVPGAYQAATVDALEFGTKNTLLDGTLQANLDAWYYNYENYQVGIIANRAALTYNIPAHLYGLEGEFVWQPNEDIAFNATLSLTRSQAGNAWAVDQRNPTAGQANAILVKDLTNGSLCVITPMNNALGALAAGHTPGESTAGYHINNFYLPNGGNAAIDAQYGIPLVNYGSCNPLLEPALNAKGFTFSQATNGKTGGPALDPVTHAIIYDGTGIAVNLHGNKLPDVPNAQVGVGGQYTFHLADEYTLVPRLDYYWQSSTESRVNNDGADYTVGWDTLNGQIQLNAPDGKWYARVFATNIFDKKNPTGVYLTDPTSALFTNVFSEDPRVVGVSVGANW